ncbi:head maturation protease, ClpP-related [Bradyrhizobium sp. 27S5]|uniref:head maturation protease, ClpP-related n=1 Tax=Bradyrhizobium sp. 27S5 TaxID=3139728 RepID=UPI0030CE98FB
MPSIARNGEILLSGAVGDGFSGEFFTYLDVVESLASLGRSRDVTVRINSGGGSAADGIAIFNALDSHKGNVTVVVESIAASAASVIAMAGQKIVMRAGSMMMIHDPSALTLGNSSDHAKSVEMLETMANSMADIYAEKTGRPVAEIRAEMKAETWMSAQEAVAKGYATRTDTARSKEPSAFDYRLYQRPPDRMAALADARGWTQSGAAVTAERQRAADIHAACQMVGRSDRATVFIAEGKSLRDVTAILQTERVSAEEIHTRPATKFDRPSALDRSVAEINARFDANHLVWGVR